MKKMFWLLSITFCLALVFSGCSSKKCVRYDKRWVQAGGCAQWGNGYCVRYNNQMVMRDVCVEWAKPIDIPTEKPRKLSDEEIEQQKREREQQKREREKQKEIYNKTLHYIGSFSEQRALIKIGNYYGYIDQSGEIVISPKWVEASDFSEGLAAIYDSNNKKYGYIDRSGEIVIKPQYDSAGNFHKGLARIKKGKKYGFINNSGEITIKPKYESVDLFHEGLARIKKGEKYGFIDQGGKIVIKPIYSDAGYFADGLANVKLESWGYIDKAGKFIIGPSFFGAYPFSEGLARVVNYRKGENFKNGYIDTSGKTVIEPQFAYATDFINGFAYANLKSSKRNSYGYHDAIYGLINKMGKMTIKSNDDYQISQETVFSNGLAPVEYRENKLDKETFKFSKKVFVGFIDKKGTLVLPAIYSKVTTSTLPKFSDGLAPVRYQGKLVYIDKSGKVVIRPSLTGNNLNKATTENFSLGEGSVWRGQYICGQGKTRLDLRLLNINQNSGNVTFRFNFKAGQDKGAYILTGQLKKNDPFLRLVPEKWIEPVDGYFMVGMAGTFKDDNRLFDGRISHESCGEFHLKKVP